MSHDDEARATSETTWGEPRPEASKPVLSQTDRYDKTADVEPLRRLTTLRAAGRLRFGTQVIDRLGPQHDETFVVAGFVADANGGSFECRTRGTGSKAAKRGAAIELLQALTDAGWSEGEPPPSGEEPFSADRRRSRR